MTTCRWMLTCISMWANLNGLTAAAPGRIRIDYPLDHSVFPPEITPPTFIWHDPEPDAALWRIAFEFSDGSAPRSAIAAGKRMQIGPIDMRCVSPTNRIPELTPEQAAARTWIPDAATWETIKLRSTGRAVNVIIRGFRKENPAVEISRGEVSIETSRDPVGAPIFYRDVPLMPSDLEKGVIKPLASSALPLVAWRLRDTGKPESRLVMTGLYTCANCHSLSADGKSLGMDLDGPRSDKGMYAIVPVAPQMSIRNRDVVTWSSFQNNTGAQLRIGFMSQLSPDGNFVVTTINGIAEGQNRGRAIQSNYYVANFTDYRFLQVFYPTRGILAWYDRAAARIRVLPGADDPRYVHTGAVWSPDGEYLVFSRAAARDPYQGGKTAEYANDPNETPIQYDLYRIPFNGGKGGRPEPITGASRNGMSNSFPKISPDGRWIVFVQARNGLLMRPDSQLYIVPAAGGPARRMRCNTSLMNSWHSFSPDGRWMVFSSKSRSPYTQMFLTHIDEDGRDSPPVLIENATAANRAVNIPEFVNISRQAAMQIDVPAAEFYRLFDRAWELGERGQDADAVAAWEKALELSPEDSRAQYNLGSVLARRGRFQDAIDHYERAVSANPDFPDAHNNFGVALARVGRVDDAIGQYRKALQLNPGMAEVHNNLGVALVWKKRPEEAIAEFRRVLELAPQSIEGRRNLGDAYYYLQNKPREAIAEWREVLRARPDDIPALTQTAWVLATCPASSVRDGSKAVRLAENAVEKSGGRDADALDALAAAYAETGRYHEAQGAATRALAATADAARRSAIQSRLALYEEGKPYRGR